MGMMKKIISFFIVVFFFGLLITLVSLIMPSKVISARTVMINASLRDITTQAFDLASWKNWNPAFQLADSIIISGPVNGKGAKAVWFKNKRQNILTVIAVSDSAIRFNIDRKGENTIVNDIYVHSFEGRSDLEVEWRSIHSLKWYPWDKFAGMFIDKATGPGYDAALKQLKELTENQ